MTALQLQYRNLVETQRSNMEKEFENRRHNTATEALDIQKHEENVRHNQVSERQNRLQPVKDATSAIKSGAETITEILTLVPKIQESKSRAAKNAASGIRDLVGSVTDILKLTGN